jgi:hypothetical protein
LKLFSSITSLCRGGRGGGYKELDEEELEEVRRRRKEAEEVCHILLYHCMCHGNKYPFLNLDLFVG